jgi:hypothetical protein
MERTGVGAEKKRLQVNSAAVSDQYNSSIHTPHRTEVQLNGLGQI